MASKVATKETARVLAGRLLDIAEEVDYPAAREHLSPVMARMESGLFRLIVVGEIKKGKSSFINAMLGHPNLLPALSDVATSTVFKLGWGERLAYRVFFKPTDPTKPGETTPPPQHIEAEEVAAFGTEDGNPDNKKGVDFIAVELPHPLLKQGLTIIDTPGLGGVFKEHAEIMWRYAPAADALFFVLDSVEAVASTPEMQALSRLRKMTPLLFFVQTKTDLAPEEQWRAWVERNLEILAETLRVPKDKLIYFPVSAKLKQAADRRKSTQVLEDSGYKALMDFVQGRLMALKEARLATQVIAAAAAEGGTLRQGAEQRLRVLTAETMEDLHRLDEEAKAARASFLQWQKAEYPVLLREFSFQSGQLQRETSNALQNRLDASSTGPILGTIMGALRAEGSSADQLVARVNEIRSQVVDLCAEQMVEIQRDYQKRTQALIEATTERMGASLPVNLDAYTRGIDPLSGEPAVDAPMHWFERTRNMFFGASAATSMTGIAVSLASVAAPIAIPALIGAAIAGLFFSRKSIEDKRREQVLSKLEGVLATNVRNVQRQAAQQFADAAAHYERTATGSFDRVVKVQTENLERRLAEIEQAKQQTRDEKAEMGESVKERLGRINALLKETAQYLGKKGTANERE
jgi:hypothetical protein